LCVCAVRLGSVNARHDPEVRLPELSGNLVV